MAKLLTTEEYANLCRVSVTTILNRIKSGELQPVKMKGYLYFNPSAPRVVKKKIGRKKASEIKPF